MVEKDISAISLKYLSSIDYKLDDRPERYQYGGSIKSIFTDFSIHGDIFFTGSKYIQLNIPSAEYKQALSNDLYFCNQRIKEQCKNLEHLIGAGAHPAWVLVTAYYAAYFMANEISKINGRMVINLSENELGQLSSGQNQITKDQLKIEAYNSYFMQVSHGEMSGEVRIKLNKSSPKPHQAVWKNLSVVLNKIEITDSRWGFFNTLKRIIDSDGWDSPSTVRNSWNYSQANYFGDKGIEIGGRFKSIIGSKSSSFGWAKNNNLQPSKENMAAGISYIYHVLKDAHSEIMRRLMIS